MEKEIQIRYNQVLKRSFKNDLKLFLFQKFLYEGIKDDERLFENYSSYTPLESLISRYLTIRQLSKSSDLIEGTNIKVGEFDTALKKWEQKNKSNITVLQKIYKENRFIKEEEFWEFYEENVIRKCYYCGITESKIEELIKENKIYTKRLLLRGKTLEIDKRDPKGNYSTDNMVFCCYWCNNAKTDEFTDKEFLVIGNSIKEIWNNRLREKE